MAANNRRFLLYVLAFQATVCVSIVLDIPFVRQVLGFIFFAFVPGYLLLKVFKIEKQHLTETIVISGGLSLALLMLIGLLLNELGSLNIISQPLAFEPLFLFINPIVAVLCVIGYVTNKNIKGLEIKGLEKLWNFIPFLLLPVLSVIGVLVAFYFQSNIVSIFVIILIVIVFVLAAFRSNLSKYYPLIVISIVLALLLSSALMSRYTYGDDIQGEFKVFLNTQNISFWNPQNYLTPQQSSDYSMLSITILPTVLSNLLNIDPTLVFKIVFPVIFSLVPLGLYELYQRQWSKKVAFVSVVFFAANYTYFTLLLTNAKQMIGELFYVILFLELLSSDANSYKSNLMILVLAIFGLVVSHYSMDFIFLIIIFFTWFGVKIFFKNAFTRINATFLVITSSLVFFWYIYIVPGGPFGKFTGTIRTTVNSFTTEFFSSSSRGQAVQAALGIATRPSKLHYVGTYLYDITILLILIGFISLVVKWRRKEKTNAEYTLIISLNIVLLIMAIGVPQFANFLQLGRLYEVLLLFLSPLFVIGVETIFKTFSRKGQITKSLNLKNENRKAVYSLILTLIILVAFFLFQTGFVYEITGDPSPSSFALSYYKMQDIPLLIHESDVYSAEWLSSYGDINSMATYSDSVNYAHVLNSYSTIDLNMIFLLSSSTGIVRDVALLYPVPKVANTSYIYLGQYNVKNGITWWDQTAHLYFNINDLPILNNTNAFVNRIYSNGYSETYFRSP